MADNFMDLKTDLDKAKKVYRAAVDAVRKLDEGLKKKKAYREVFHQDVVGLRYKLKLYCERLLFYNPLYYGRKAEEVLWRKVFYDIIQLIKKNRRHVRPGSSLETAYRTHLSSASGYYYHLLFRLQRDFNLKLENKIDFHLLPDNNPGRYGKAMMKKDVTHGVQEWAQKAVHRCLLYLGDIARYQQDFDNGMSAATAERFYQQALIVFPDIGMPHNQLGTLASSRYFYCDAAYHYIRCMACETPFEGADGNLLRLFEKNQKRFHDLKQETGKQANNPEEQCYHDLKGFFVRLLNLLRIFYDTSNQIDSQEIQECCQATLQSFNQCMFYEPVVYCDDSSEDSLHYMEDDVVFKIVVICMATIYILQKKGSKKVTAATAFLLALFSHILNHVVIRLQAALYEKENPNKILQSKNRLYDTCNGEDSESDKSSTATETSLKNGHVRETSSSDGQSLMETKDKLSVKPKRKKSRRRMRRRPTRGQSFSDDSDLSELSDLSEGETVINDQFMSDDSEDEVLGFYDDSDSDMSDSLMKSQEMEPGFATNPEADSSDINLDSVNLLGLGNPKSDIVSPLFPNSDQSKIWSDSTKNDSLASFSSELFSSSVPFLGGNCKFSQPSEGYDADVIQGNKPVSVPPGFAQSSEAKHVEEISQKLANFVIETDTEASVTATEAEFSTELDDNSSDENEKIGSSQEEKEAAHQQNVIDAIQGEGLMPAIKVMTDWMKCNSNVIKTCAQSSQSVWCRLSILLNFLPHESVYLQHDQCWLPELRQVIEDIDNQAWTQQLYLREDMHLISFPPLKDVHESLDMKLSVRMTDLQESFLRTCSLRKFGYFLSNLDGLQFSFNREKGLFIGPTQPITEDDTEEIAMEKLVNAESRRNQLMRDMAQLRLQIQFAANAFNSICIKEEGKTLEEQCYNISTTAEVSQLEGSLSTTEPVPFPPYLIPDASSLCSMLPLLRKLSQTNRSIIVIPLAVIDTLDFQKKESLGAREAIRWLEGEFRKGNRYIRAQKNSEKLQVVVPRQLKKKSRETWCTLEIINCALYLSSQGGDLGTETVITILTSNDFSSSSHPLVKQALATSKQEGVAVENISEFVGKWSDILNKG